MASTNYNAFAPIGSAFIGIYVQPAGHVGGAYVGMFLPAVSVGSREGHGQGAMLPMRVRSPIYLLRGQFAGSTETWIGSTPDTAPPSGHVVTDRSYIVLDY